jgi:hypothetical protein
MPNVKPLNDALKIETYSLQKCVKFSVDIPSHAGTTPHDEVAVPVAIVYRLHHLGRAFDGQAVKHLLPQGMFRIGFIDTQRLISELELVSTVVSDPVSLHYLAKLLPLLRSTSGHPSSAVKVAES